MGAAENKQLMQHIFAEFDKGNPEPFLANMAEDIRWTCGSLRFPLPPGTIPIRIVPIVQTTSTGNLLAKDCLIGAIPADRADGRAELPSGDQDR
jgi:hypothetical protein